MVTIRCRSADLAGTRFAFSPLWEAVAGFRAWRLGAPHLAALGWSDLFRAVAPAEQWRWLDLVALAPSGRIPDFLAPPPPGPFATFEEELGGLRETPWRVIAAELRGAYGGVLPSGAPHTAAGRVACLDGIRRELELFWLWALAPLWPRLRGVLEAEVVYRSRLLAFGGVEAVFHDLHEAVRFTRRGAGGVLRVRTSERADRRAAGAGVLLVPSMFAWPEVYVVVRPPWRPTLAYPARGVAELWGQPSGRSSETGRQLAALLGVARARVLGRLRRPSTTTELSAALGMSLATVSQHLSRLRHAGVLDRARVGRRVYYSVNEWGQVLLRRTS